MERLIKNTIQYKTQEAYSLHGKLNHACLLLFPDAASLRTALKIFAKLFFLNQKTTTDQNRINSLIDKEAYADCLFFPENGSKFTVSCAESVEEECALRPVEGKNKLFVIGDFSQATREAQNKMLKMLEEPPEGVSFLLGATSAFSVLPTVLSRVEKIEISPFSEEEITAYLYRNVPDLSQEDALLCSKSSGGIAGKALELATGGYFKELTQAAWSLSLCSKEQLPYLVKQYAETNYKKELLSLLKIIFFDALKLKITEESASPSARITYENQNKNERKNRTNLAAAYSKGALLKAQSILSNAEKQLFFNGTFAQILEISISKILAEKRA